ncbi:MAG: hypothetical protein Kow0076_3760 [Francisella sp.]
MDYKKERGLGIVHLSQLFEKYKKTLIAPEKSVINTFLEVIQDLYGWNIPRKNISFNTKSKIISIKNGGPIVSEIKLNKKEILNHLRGRLGEKNTPKDII